MREVSYFKLFSVAEVVRGVSYNSQVASNVEQKNTIPILRAGNIQQDLITDKDLVFVDSSYVVQNQLIKKNDIAMCMSSGSPTIVGKTAFSYKDTKCSVGAFCSIIRPKSNIDARYLFHFLNSTLFRNWTQSSQGINIKNIKTNELKEFLIPCLPLDEQRRIAAILDKADAIRRKRQEALKLADDFLKSVFLDMFGDPVTNPKGWEIVPLEKPLLFLTSGSRGWARYYSSDGEMFLTIKNVRDNRISTDNIQYIKAPQTKEAERTKVQEGDLLISITADLGRTGVVPKSIASYGTYINQHLSLIRLDQSLMNPVFASFYLESKAGKDQFASKNQMGVKAGLNFDAVKSLRLFSPPIELQNQFAAFVEQADKSKVAMQRQLQGAEFLKASLMHQYFCQT